MTLEDDFAELATCIFDDRRGHQFIPDSLLSPNDERLAGSGRIGLQASRLRNALRFFAIGADHPFLPVPMAVELEAFLESARFEIEQREIPLRSALHRAGLAPELHRALEMRDAPLRAALVHEHRAEINKRGL